MEKQKVAIYARVSTSNKGQDLDTQLLPLQRYCKERDREITEIYTDIMSGSKESRPSLNQLLDDAQAHKFDTVIVFRFDRISRSTKQLIDLLERFRKLNISFISINENIDTTTPAGSMMFTIIAAFAKFERDIISERVRFGIEKAKANGKQIGRKIIAVDKEKIIDYHCQGISIREISKLCGVSKSKIHRILSQKSLIYGK
ncbi:MAG: hypothetical protein RL023_857 [Candidatus Parcubacteria bacterium]|jgi:DNA invertase Pin-like site-specific DNA recombinase